MTTTWNHRIVKTTDAYGEVEYGIYEVYYDDDRPVARTENPAGISSEQLETVVIFLEDIINAGVLDDKDIDSEQN